MLGGNIPLDDGGGGYHEYLRKRRSSHDREIPHSVAEYRGHSQGSKRCETAGCTTSTSVCRISSTGLASTRLAVPFGTICQGVEGIGNSQINSRHMVN
jgi:hypothetical protein